MKLNSDASKAKEAKTPSAQTLRGLDWLNFFLADVQTGVGPFLAIYLAGYKWNEERVGLALMIGGIAGILTQTPAGALVDHLRSKRALIAAGVIVLAVGALLIALGANLLVRDVGPSFDWRHLEHFRPCHLRHFSWDCGTPVV
jgi:MFS family permease